MNVLKGYRFRIYPNKEQQEFFTQTFGCVRFVYNHLLMARKEEHYSAESLKLTPASLKATYPFLKKTDSLALANAQRNLDRAFLNFFKGRAGYPNLKSKKKTWQSYTTNNQKHTIYFEEGKLKVPKLKTLIDVHQHREVKGQIKSATISAKNSEEYYVSLLCLEEITALPKTKKVVGVAYCPKHLVSVSCGREHLPELTKSTVEERLARARQKLELRAKIVKKRKVHRDCAKNYQKQKRRVDKLYLTRAYQKNDYIDKLTLKLIEQYDYVFLEKEPNFEKNCSFTETDWHVFMQKLRYKGKWYGKELRLIDIASDQEEKSETLEHLGRTQFSK
ncbi:MULTISPECIES: RNA-guided endonuclease TnpB family protein [Enterococcus]|uniref:Transposase putative helix-turn-helix domain-containing protein n=1 Tax=Enterococcus sulfureus ATCC 49903 TaxID=1140003 RepID=S0L7Q9_9ENTE|nr:RNA-guided endonuclease TnpB family protein [Enterococcus sulfureus]EOT49470.1 hypothetical protein OMY_00398 [Enterococcus sulfureus ATCC 49903]EOT87337.1 hypothetical protein I573_00393 [Enterococcus sulfureus ATCC 49903]